MLPFRRDDGICDSSDDESFADDKVFKEKSLQAIFVI